MFGSRILRFGGIAMLMAAAAGVAYFFVRRDPGEAEGSKPITDAKAKSQDRAA